MERGRRGPRKGGPQPGLEGWVEPRSNARDLTPAACSGLPGLVALPPSLVSSSVGVSTAASEGRSVNCRALYKAMDYAVELDKSSVLIRANI